MGWVQKSAIEERVTYYLNGPLHLAILTTIANMLFSGVEKQTIFWNILSHPSSDIVWRDRIDENMYSGIWSFCIRHQSNKAQNCKITEIFLFLRDNLDCLVIRISAGMCSKCASLSLWNYKSNIISFIWLGLGNIWLSAQWITLENSFQKWNVVLVVS